VTGRALLFFVEYVKRVCSHPCLFACRQVKNARAPFGPEDIAKVALKVMSVAGVDTAGWKAHALRGAAATQFVAKGVPGVVVQARGSWASSASMATHYSQLHQLIPWAELAASHPDWAMGSGDIASSSSTVLPKCQPPFNFFNFGGRRKIGIIAGWCKLCGTKGEADDPPVGVDSERRKGGPRHSPLGTHNYWTPIFPLDGKHFQCVP